jgi:murein L,D-transpeptidase YafK
VVPLRGMAGAWLAVLVSLAGCSGLARWLGLAEEPPPSPPPIAATADEEHLAWAEKEPIFVVVRQSCRTLDVYRFGKRIRSYPAVFGQGGTPKVHEGDRRTPIGLYSVLAKYPHPKWRYFFLIDYPNGSDVFRYDQANVAGELPQGAGIGGSVGIHGTDKPDLNRRGVDWTWGCVSLDNDAIEDLYGVLPVGTPIVIQE